MGAVRVSASGVELVDCHTHTVFSDGAGSVSQNAAAAVAAGCTTLACTDHLARPEWIDCFIDEARIPELAASVAEARAAYPALDMVFGFEADYYEGCAADIAEARGNATFLLGSVHYLGEYCIDWKEDMRLWEGVGPDEVWRRYADTWCAACFCDARFDSMAHPDLPRMGETFGFSRSVGLRMEPLWDAMAAAARESGVRVEVSTAGLDKSFRGLYPEEGLLRRFCKAGVPITVGSDAHAPERVAHAIEKAYAYAYECGYRSIEVPTATADWRTVAL